MKPKETDRKSTTGRHKTDLTLSRVRSALTNGSRLVLADIDERGLWCRRLRDLQAAYEADMGGADLIGEAQRAIIRRAAMLQLQLEMMEVRFAENDGEASPRQLKLYQTASNSMRRLLESVELHRGRVAKDITPSLEEYLSQRAGA